MAPRKVQHGQYHKIVEFSRDSHTCWQITWMVKLSLHPEPEINFPLFKNQDSSVRRAGWQETGTNLTHMAIVGWTSETSEELLVLNFGIDVSSQGRQMECRNVLVSSAKFLWEQIVGQIEFEWEISNTC